MGIESILRVIKRTMFGWAIYKERAPEDALGLIVSDPSKFEAFKVVIIDILMPIV